MLSFFHLRFNNKKNIGDRFIVESVKKILKESFEGSSYSDLDIFHTIDKKYPSFIHKKIFTKKPYQDIIKILKIPWFIKNPFLEALKQLRNHQDYLLVQKINKHSCLIIGGGGILSKNTIPLKKEILNQIKIPIILFGIGYNQIITNNSNLLENSKFKKGVSDLVKKASAISVRDSNTLKVVNFFDDKNRAINIGDLSIHMQKISEEKKSLIKDKKKIIIGVNLIHHIDNVNNLTKNFNQKIIKQVNNLTKKLKEIDKREVELKLLIHTKEEASNAKKNLQQLNNAKLCKFKNEDDIIKKYNEMDFVINSSLHSCLFSYINNVIFINNFYDLKNKSFLEDINQTESLIHSKELDDEDFYYKKFLSLQANQRKIEKKYKESKKNYKESYTKFINIIKKLINKA